MHNLLASITDKTNVTAAWVIFLDILRLDKY